MSPDGAPRWSRTADAPSGLAYRPAGVPVEGPASADRRITAAATREGHGVFLGRQTLLLLAVMAALIVGQTASSVFGGLTFPLLVPGFPYLGSSLLLATILIGGVGLLTVTRAKDTGWPILLSFIGLWIVVFAIEDSVLQWFTFQLGVGFSGGRINVVQISSFMLALGLAVLIHMNQVGRRLHAYFADRGIDREELAGVESHVRMSAHKIVWPIVGTTAAASVVLLIGEAALGRARLGAGALGIMGGLAVILVLATLVFRALAEGPSGIEEKAAASDGNERNGPPRW